MVTRGLQLNPAFVAYLLAYRLLGLCMVGLSDS